MSNDGSMWYCPECEIWVGSKLDPCQNGHSKPTFPVLYDDVEKPAFEVTRKDRSRAKWRGLARRFER